MQDRPARRRRPRRRQPLRPRTADSTPARAPERALEGRLGRRAARQRERRPQREDLRAGAPCVILLDSREGEPDRSGASAVFEGYFDLETGEPRRAANGIPRLRVQDERVWGFECWWRPDPERTGFTPADREQLEVSKRLLRGLLRDARRSAARALGTGARSASPPTG